MEDRKVHEREATRGMERKWATAEDRVWSDACVTPVQAAMARVAPGPGRNATAAPRCATPGNDLRTGQAHRRPLSTRSPLRALRLAATLALLVALHLAPAGPAEAQQTVLLSGTLTVGGVANRFGFSTHGSYGSLTDTSFTRGGQRYEVSELNWTDPGGEESTDVLLSISPAPPSRAFIAELALYLGNRMIRLDGATYSVSGGAATIRASPTLPEGQRLESARNTRLHVRLVSLGPDPRPRESDELRPGQESIWSSTLTTGLSRTLSDLGNTTGHSIRGYVPGSIGSLSDDDFTIQGRDYEVTYLAFETFAQHPYTLDQTTFHYLVLELSRSNRELFRYGAFALRVGYVQYPFADALKPTITVDGKRRDTFWWPVSRSELPSGYSQRLLVQLVQAESKLSVADADAHEGTDDSLDFVVTLAPASAKTVTVRYATRNGTATTPYDYTSSFGRLTFAPGETTKTISVPMRDDDVEDSGETVTLTLSRPTNAMLADATATGTIMNTETSQTSVPAALTASFENVPESHDGDTTFSFDLAFSENVPDLSYTTVQAAFTVTGGTVTQARRKLRGSNRSWEIHVEPGGDDDVSITLPAGAVSTSGNRSLEGAVSATVPGPETSNGQSDETPAVLTVAYETRPPAEHDGNESFSFRFAFSEDLQASYTFTTMRDHSLTIMQGTTRLTPKVRRVTPGSNQSWDVTVTPDGHESISIALGPTASCSATGAMCTAGGQALSNALPSVTVQGPPGISVADASVREESGATLDFTITLSRPRSSGRVVVSYETRDGTATAGADYTATSSWVAFAAGETSRTVSVPVLDDGIDESSETLTLVLSDPYASHIVDGEATGTITNDDPMPQAWLARFGRTVAGQAVDAIGGRMERGGFSHVTVGGRSLSLSGGAMVRDEREGVERVPMARAETGDEPRGTSRGLTGREVLLASSFHLASGGGEAGGTAFSAWGRFATAGFEADVNDVRLDGSVTSGFLGADVGTAERLVGMALSVSEGDGSYTLLDAQDDDSGDVESSLTAFYPYARLSLSRTVDVWGLVGYGTGKLRLTQHPGTERAMTYETDLGMRMGAIGARGEVISPAEPDRLMVALDSDAFWVHTSSDAVNGPDGNLAASQADVTRVRLVVEGSRSFAAGSGTLTPLLELGIRHDGGDAETGTGIEAGAALRYAGGGVIVEGAVRTLLAHEETGYEEWGASGSIRIDPGHSGEGLSLSVSPSWGAASSGVDRLWSLSGASRLAPDGAFEAGQRLEAEVGYGLGLRQTPGVLTPFVGLSLADDGQRAWRSGMRWQIVTEAALSLEGTRSEAASGEPPAHDVALRFEARW